MAYRENDDPIGLDSVVHGVGKSLQPTMADVCVKRGMDFRIRLDSIQDSLNLDEKVFTQSFALHLVPGIDLIDLFLYTPRWKTTCELIAAVSHAP